ncbi:MAG TPA: alpha/beta hydrolase [Acidimicrobiales bacterium]|nr:alpha/beta hydrolase [Acidimicrobiales bacterium]
MQLHYVLEGSGPGLLFVHGWCGESSHFDRQIGSLRGDYRVLVPDLPWHGQSPREGEITIEAFSAALAELLDELGGTPVAVVGHSMGGCIAVELATSRPDLVSSVMILDSGFAIAPEHVEAMTHQAARYEGPDRDEAIDQLTAGMFAPSDDPGLRKRLIDQIRDAPVEVLVEGTRTMVDFMAGPGDAKYAGLDLPVALVSGSTPFSDIERLRPLRPETHFAQVLSAGHYVQLFAAPQIDAMIRQFLTVAGD